MQLATLNAEALAGLLTVDVGIADFPSDCLVELARVVTSTVLALLLLAARYPVRRFLRGVFAGDARIVTAMLLGALIFFLGDAWFSFWSLTDCLGGGGDTGTPDWWPLVPVGVLVVGMWKSGVFDGENPEGEESEGGGPEDGE